jgi:hypothetical protein
MKTIKRNTRIWFAVLLISAAALCATWAVPPGGPGGNPSQDLCWEKFSGCTAECKREWEGGWVTEKEFAADVRGCFDRFLACERKKPAIGGAGTAPGQSQPPNKQGPTPTTTPRKLPIKGPPRRLGPSPSPSATAKPILLDKPARPTPSPKPTPKKDSYGHH